MYIVEHRMQDEAVSQRHRARGVRRLPSHRAGAVLASLQGRMGSAGRTCIAGTSSVSEQSSGAVGAAAGGRCARRPPPGPSIRRQPSDMAVEYLAKDYPLDTPEWAAWRARMRAPKLSRTLVDYRLSAGRGKVIGEMVIEPGATEDEFTTNVKLTYLKDGTTVTRSGKSMVYTGYSWRGRSHYEGRAASLAPAMRGRARGAARSDVDRAGSDPDGRPLVLGRLSRSSATTSRCIAPATASDRARRRIDTMLKTGSTGAARQDLRRQFPAS